MKEAYYFKHDYEARHDLKVVSMLSEFGAEGYGMFWAIIEQLHSEPEHRLPIKKYIWLALAKHLLSKPEQIEIFVKECIETHELFGTDGEYFWSERVFRNFLDRQKISDKRSNAGREGGLAKANAKQILASAEQNIAKKRKEKENKVQENKAGEPAYTQPLKNEISEKTILRGAQDVETPPDLMKPTSPPPIVHPEQPEVPKIEKFKRPARADVEIYFETKITNAAQAMIQSSKFIDYYTSNGWKVGKNPMKDWQAAARNWIRNSNSQFNTEQPKPFKYINKEVTPL